ncbi:hypothetical protein [Laspinema palackyanum]
MKAAYEYQEEGGQIYETRQPVSEGQKCFEEGLEKVQKFYGKE